jgi:hypothetical protein
MKNQNGFAAIELIFVIVFSFGILGYILNIYKLAQCDFEPSYKEEVIRTFGLFPPVGAVVGYLNFGK